uniref:uncharacterized protein LOC105352506 n=1 Tax=Fragaria vesca subsp. vesca TaxID=101020 RepID=UPI0005C9705A|nr:PREDICTED: uncharacterized protein LOC105352506 [Fragaria vesca subsp. vesca]
MACSLKVGPNFLFLSLSRLKAATNMYSDWSLLIFSKTRGVGDNIFTISAPHSCNVEHPHQFYCTIEQLLSFYKGFSREISLALLDRYCKHVVDNRLVKKWISVMRYLVYGGLRDLMGTISMDIQIIRGTLQFVRYYLVLGKFRT